jgi:2-polyprenyl-3-methyl-5-hydroxy-6-metoxy-1,4-benzoquinol methylase
LSHTTGAGREAFTATEARTYWDRRHAESDDLASGGNISMSRAENAMFYAVRTARLLEVLGTQSDPASPLRVLDAGCGQGHFSRAIASFGHRVDGIDTSEVAVAGCRAAAGPLESYALSALQDWSPSHLYDVVVSIDVLYHLMDDREWEASVRHLASLVRLGGRIGLVDHQADADRTWSHYQKTRAAGRYRAVLEECGMTVERFVRNDFRDDPAGMHVAVRVA